MQQEFLLIFSLAWCIIRFQYPGVAQLVARLLWEFDRVETSCHNPNRKTR